MSASLRLGIVGCGDIARYTAFFARLNPRIRLAACCDLQPGAAQTFARRYRIPASFASFDEMLEKVQLDAVYLSVPHDLHLPMVRRAVEACIPVLCEKPAAATMEDAQEMARLARSSQIKIGINYQYRYDAACYGMARGAQKGELGRLLYARVNVPWRRQDDYVEKRAWHASLARSGGGTLLTQGSHFLDVVLWAAGRNWISAQGVTARQKFVRSEVEDLAMGIIRLDDGLLIEICSSMVATPERLPAIELYGEDGTAVYTGSLFPRLKLHGVHPRLENPPVRGIHALYRSLEAFRRWIVDDMPYLTPVEEALPVLKAVQALYRSARNGVIEHNSDANGIPQGVEHEH